MKRTLSVLIVCTLMTAAIPFVSLAEDPSYNTYASRYAMDIPNFGPVWVGIREHKNYITADALWVGGSVVPTAYAGKIQMDDVNGYLVNRVSRIVRERNEQGQPTKWNDVTDSLVLDVSGNYVEGLFYLPPRNNQQDMRAIEFFGKKIPPLPEAPDLGGITYGDPVTLFNGEDLSGWKLLNPNQTNGWVVEDGILHNRPKQTKGQPHISYGNLRTEAEFEDFNLRLDVNVPKNGNSGVYLRGIYEVQVLDSFGKPLDSHHMGAVYSRITPKVAAEKPAGEWQTMDITLYQRHVTVILNGKKIIDNHPLLGVTGGAMTTDESKPGPIYLQGDHDYVSYKNMVLTPIVE